MVFPLHPHSVSQRDRYPVRPGLLVRTWRALSGRWGPHSGQVLGSRARRRAVPPPGSWRCGPRRLLLQLPLPYKAGAGPRRGRSCGRPASSSALGAARGRQGAQREPKSARSLPWANQVSPPCQPGRGAGMARSPRLRGLHCHSSRGGLDPRGAGRQPPPGRHGSGCAPGPLGAGWRGSRRGQFPGQPGSRGGRRALGREGGRRDRGRVLLSASQRLRQGGLPGADGISAQRPAKAWLLLCFRTGLELEKATEL